MSPIANGAGGHLLLDAVIPEVPKVLNIRSVKRELVSFKDSQEAIDHKIAAHVFFWAPCDRITKFGVLKAAVMMHLRFDGSLGFPGGLIDEGEDILDGLHRELKEEINYSTEAQRSLTYEDYHHTRVLKDQKLTLHFFVAELTLAQFEALEKSAVSAEEYGDEVFGTVRIPLYTMENKYNGFPAFLNNRFIGCAKHELLMSLFACKIFTNEEIEQVISNMSNMKLASHHM